MWVMLETRDLRKRKLTDRHRVEPRPHVGGQKLIDKHAGKGNPKDPQRLGGLELLPVQALHGLDDGQAAPVDGVDVPDGDGADQAADAVAEQADGDDGQHDGHRLELEVVEEILRRKGQDGLGRVGRGCGGDGADGVLLEAPGPGVDDGRDADPERRGAGAAAAAAPAGSPPGLEPVAAGQQRGPGGAGKVRDEHDEERRHLDLGRLELVDLVQRALKRRQARGQEYAAKRQRRVPVVPEREQVVGHVLARDDDDVLVVAVLDAVAAAAVFFVRAASTTTAAAAAAAAAGMCFG